MDRRGLSPNVISFKTLLLFDEGGFSMREHLKDFYSQSCKHSVAVPQHFVSMVMLPMLGADRSKKSVLSYSQARQMHRKGLSPNVISFNTLQHFDE
eukprot:5318837-Karenia_brevis.AAC.1